MKFKSDPIGIFNIDVAEVKIAEGKLYMFVTIDRTSKFTFVELHRQAKQRTAGEFLKRLARPSPTKSTLADNVIHFTTPGAGGSAVPFIREATANGVLYPPTLSPGRPSGLRCPRADRP